ncbi:FecR family protein [Aureibaculum algae]|uniref:FecR family protein n=1 Tax=Aureibaculum algae TaxID=2584122 RepID=A0A5B7TS49_9FLAO|nr:FecR family protein [Aureibaculum algae]QCX37442.1 FecR family protein [Aureibaculum algae]
MKLPEIEILIIKYLNNSANSSELDMINKWLQNPESELTFKKYVKTHLAITSGMNNPDSQKIKEKLQEHMRKDKSISYRFRINSVLKYAAIAILFMAILYSYQKGFFNTKSLEENVPQITDITLKLDNGAIEIISENKNSDIVNQNGGIIGIHKGTQLIYFNDDSGEKLKFNTLNVPYGKRFNVVLSDGTNIFLNSGSSLKYPINFSKGSNRQVFLKGEAYFDVTHNIDHPFVVTADEMNVSVLGTKFNVSNYDEDNKSEVVLVDGSVRLNVSNNKKMLEPSYKASFNKTLKSIATERVDTHEYTAWINGNIIFRNTPFNKIIKKLERAYNITIVNNNKKLANENFNATIEIDKDTIEEVLGYFNKIYSIEFKIINNKIIIN